MIARKEIEKNIYNAINPAIEEMEYNIVRIRHGAGNLQIMLEGIDYAKIGIDDCGKASRKISFILSETNVAKGNHNLEVSTAGINRPLTTIQDFSRFKGEKVKLKLSNPISYETKNSKIIELKTVRATMNGMEDNKVIFIIDVNDEEKKEVKVEFSEIDDVRLSNQTITNNNKK